MLLGLVAADQHDLRRRVALVDLPDQPADAIAGALQGYQQDVDAGLRQPLESFRAARNLPHHLEPPALAEKRRQAVPEKLVMIDDDQAQSVLLRSSLQRVEPAGIPRFH